MTLTFCSCNGATAAAAGPASGGEGKGAAASSCWRKSATLSVDKEGCCRAAEADDDDDVVRSADLLFFESIGSRCRWPVKEVDVTNFRYPVRRVF